MELSCTNIFVQLPSFTGIVKISLTKEIYNLNIKFEAFRLLNLEQQNIVNIYSICYNEHSNKNILNMFSLDLTYSKKFNLNESEYFTKYLGNIINNGYSDKTWKIELNFSNSTNHFNIDLNYYQISRMYNFFRSFCSNYLLYDIITSDINNKSEVKPKEIIEHVKEIKSIGKNLDNDIRSDNEDLSSIIDLCVSPAVKSILIHYTLIYYQNQECKVENDRIEIPLIFPIGCDVNFIKSLIHVNKSHDVSQILMFIRKLIFIITKDKIPMVFVLMSSFLLFIYIFRYIHELKPNAFEDILNQIITNPDYLTMFMNNGLGKIPKLNKVINFKINNINNNSITDKNIVNEISQKYEHLIAVSQKDFADRVFNESNNKSKSKTFVINNKKIFDIQNILDRPKVDSSTGLLNYQYINKNIISIPYKYLLDYIKNPSIIFTISEKEIPKTVVNLFDTLSRILPKIHKDNCITFNYYQMLVDNLTDPSVFEHDVYLFIIFQIIIPYMYDMYKTSQFIDVFL